MDDNVTLTGTDTPQPGTSNGWSPVEAFDGSHVEGNDFLVWLIDEFGNGFCMLSQWHPEYDVETQIPVGEPRFNGEWRAMSHLEDLEPVAYRLLPEGPDLGVLTQIVETHFKKAA
jgi:hypothetical protein